MSREFKRWLGKLAGEGFGCAWQARDIAGGLVERVQQALPGIGAPLIRISVGPDQSALDNTGEGQGTLAQVESVTAR